MIMNTIIEMQHEIKIDDEPDPVLVRVATTQDAKYALFIVNEMEASAKARGTGIAHRSVESICTKMDNGEAVIAVTQSGTCERSEKNGKSEQNEGTPNLVTFCQAWAWGSISIEVLCGSNIRPLV